MAKRVILGMSGGVDSSTAAVILKNQGYEVVGITFKFIDSFDSKDAIDVANKLNIEHNVVDYRKEFKEKIIDKFIEDYKRGITPNPCVECNKHVKLYFLYNLMEEYNCDFIATGHYARMERTKLYRSVDLNKDQTYFLSEVPQKILNKMLFPLEGLNKDDVRRIAEDNGLTVANKKDSTDVCFINASFNDYMKENIKIKEGNIIDVETNKIIGKHKGLAFYTIGQRKGLEIGGSTDKIYVVGKDINKNILYVAYGSNTDYLLSDECIIEDVNLIGYHKPTFATAKFRYRSKEVPADIEYLEDDKKLRVKLHEPTSSITPGQTCALYLGEECFGGGTITEVRKNGEKLWYL